jgi:hypothetical protein
LTGNDVRNLQGEDVGHIKELMIDLRTGRITYAVLSFGGILGLGDKLFAVPWAALRLNQEENFFLLDVFKERLEKAPGFDKDHWPNMQDPAWSSEVDRYYGVAVRRYDG